MTPAGPGPRCNARTPGNVLTSYECAKAARPGSSFCYWHDPATEQERERTAARRREDRRLEREAREGVAR